MTQMNIVRIEWLTRCSPVEIALAARQQLSMSATRLNHRRGYRAAQAFPCNRVAQL